MTANLIGHLDGHLCGDFTLLT
uniref:Uncharacterized protein n=1 Tax=Lepeophtheirus salmonis TaxID=72036 RepID=A0A0K2TAD5_LEPSM